NPDLVIPSFEKLYGIPSGTHILTRVERQMGGGRIPPILATVGDLPRCIEMNPFDSLEFISGGLSEPDPNHYPFTEYCAGMFLRRMAEEQGMQAVMNFI